MRARVGIRAHTAAPLHMDSMSYELVVEGTSRVCAHTERCLSHTHTLTHTHTHTTPRVPHILQAHTTTYVSSYY
jgi:hypothetical protein